MTKVGLVRWLWIGRKINVLDNILEIFFSWVLCVENNRMGRYVRKPAFLLEHGIVALQEKGKHWESRGDHLLACWFYWLFFFSRKWIWQYCLALNKLNTSLTGLSLCRSYSANHNCSNFICVTAMTCPEGILLLGGLMTSSSEV